MKKIIIAFLLNQYFFSLIITIGVIFFLPDYFLKYTIELQRQVIRDKSFRVYFEDLNNDGTCEEILSIINTAGDAAIMIYDADSNLLDQWNFDTQPTSSINKLFFSDIDGNAFQEIYTITKHKDSAFLNIIEPLANNGIRKVRIFIDTISGYNGENKFRAECLQVENLKPGTDKEVLFSIFAGYSGNPRNVYKYNFGNNKITKSPHLTNVFDIKQIIDINNDGFKEIIISASSAGNKIDSVYTHRSDSSTWLTILDHNLNFLFDPIEFKVSYAGIKPIQFNNGNNYKLFTLINSSKSADYQSKLLIISTSGVILKEKQLPKENCNIYSNEKLNNFILFNRETGVATELDSNFNEIKKHNTSPNSYLFKVDIDKDGENEWLIKSMNNIDLSIYRNDFKGEISFKLPNIAKESIYFGLKEVENSKDEIYFQKGYEFFVYKYYENPYYYFKYLFYLVIFLVINGLIWLIIKGQKLRTDKQLAVAKEINQLQIKAIKNQVDPHFVFNAINTISGLMINDDKFLANEFIGNFSDLMRSALQNSDKITSTLEEEINYVKKYILLQQVRFDQKFQYTITVAKTVDLKTIIPKYVLYTYVENAIKHGLLSKEKGLLKIEIYHQLDRLVLAVEDNGGGLKTLNKKYSTGKGLLIMEEIYRLFAKFYKKKISHQIKEVKDVTDKVTGVRVEILI